MAESSDEKPKVTLYWLNTSRAQRILWLLEECKGIDYNIEVFKRGKDFRAPADLKKIHPLGKSPLISVQTSSMPQPLVLAESGPIVEYLCDYFAQHLVPKRYQEGKEGQVGGETEQWLRYRYFMHYAEGSLMPLLLIALFMDQIRNAPVPFFIRPIVKAIPTRVEVRAANQTGHTVHAVVSKYTDILKNMFLNKEFEVHWTFLESQLNSSPDGGKYLCGKDITAADILMSFPLIAASRSKVDMSAYSKLTEYVKLLEQNEVYQRSIKKIEEVSGEPFKALL